MGRTDDKARTSWGQRGSLIAFDASGLPREGAVQGKMSHCCWEPQDCADSFSPSEKWNDSEPADKPWRRTREAQAGWGVPSLSVSYKGLHSVPNYMPGFRIFPLLSFYPHVISQFELINVCNPDTDWGE